MKKIILFLAFFTTIVSADLFEKGRSSVGIVAGSSSYNGDVYTIIGVEYNYFVMDGLSVGSGYRGWFGGDSTINQLTIASNYYILYSKKLRPYIGGFIKKTFENNNYIEDRNYELYGIRGGLAVAMSPNSYASFGYAYEKYTNCTESFFQECSSAYPELVFSLAF